MSEGPAVEFRNVTKRFRLRTGTTLKELWPSLIPWRPWKPPFVALDGLSFTANRGEALGIIGANGNGKSTTLRLIAGIMAPTEGQVLTRGRVCPLIDLGVGFHPDLTGKENVFLNASILGLTNAESRERFEEIVAFAELEPFMDTPVKHYSSGMHLRLAFAVAVHSDPDILLVDEVLAVGDASFQEKCISKIREFPAGGATVIFVSHALSVVESFCDRVMVLDRGRLVATGEPGEMIERYLAMAGGIAVP